MKTKEYLHNLNQSYYPKHLYYAPRWLVMGVNNVCNLHCKMCDVGTKSTETIFSTNLVGTKPIDMPLDLFESVVSQSKKYYSGTRLGYAFTEPLIYRHFDESLELTQKYKIHTSITTNALKLREKADVIVHYNTKEVFISLDGTQDIHNDIRGHRHSFQRAIEGMEKIFCSKNPPKISIFCVITEWNIGKLYEFVKFFQSFPIENIGFMHTNFTTGEIADTHNSIYANKYRATHSNIEEASIEKMNLDILWQDITAIKSMKTNCPVTFSPEIMDRDSLNRFYFQPEEFIGNRCKDVFNNIMIKSDGSVIPAHGRCFNIKVGNLYESSLKDIWNSSIIADFRHDLNKAGGLLPACSRCCSAFSE